MRASHVIIATAVLGAALWLASAVAAVARYESAALDRRTGDIAQMTDMAAVKAGVRRRTQARLMGELRSDDELRENPLGGFGLALAPSLSAGIADSLATPEALGVLVATGDPPRTPVEAAYPPSPGERAPVSRRLSLRGLNEVALVVRRRSDPAARASALVFARRKLLDWRVVDVELPG